MKKRYFDNSEIILKKDKERYDRERENILNKKREYYVLNREKIVEIRKDYYCKNRDKILDEKSEYFQRTKEDRYEYVRNRRKRPDVRISMNVSSYLFKLLKNKKSGTHWEKFLDYDKDTLKNHLEKQFKPGMTWDNYGEWHIDHKIPVRAFNFSSPTDIDFKRCWSLSNLQPLWARENFSKGGKIDTQFQPCLRLAVNE